MATRSSVLAWRIPGTGEPVGCRLWGRAESDTIEATQQQRQCTYANPKLLISLSTPPTIFFESREFVFSVCESVCFAL